MARRHTPRRTPGAVRGGIARERRSVLFGGARRKPVLWGLAALVVVLAAAFVVLIVRPAVAEVALDGGLAARDAARPAHDGPRHRPARVAAALGVPAGSPTLAGRTLQSAAGAPGPVDLAPLGTATPVPTPTADANAVAPETGTVPSGFDPVRWHDSRALGRPNDGRLADGTQLPAEGLDFYTWDWQLRRSPNRGFRRWGTDDLVRTVVMTLADHRYANPSEPRVGVADLSRTHGGSFGAHWGGSGHASHQNGLDVDVLLPRLDGRPRPPARPSQVDRAAAQDLVDRFVAAGAQFVFVGQHVGLTGPPAVVQAIPNHDDHLHVRIRPPS